MPFFKLYISYSHLSLRTVICFNISCYSLIDFSNSSIVQIYEIVFFFTSFYPEVYSKSKLLKVPYYDYYIC